MKYPGIQPAGSGPSGSGWEHAGSDLTLAARLLRRGAGSTTAIQLAEVLRRAFATDDALQALRSVRLDDQLRPATLLCTGNIHWTVGEAARALPAFEEARHLFDDAGDDEGVLAATLGLARCARLTYRRDSRPVLDAAVERAAPVAEVHLLADLDRERAAWALLAGDHQEALERSRRAAAVHREAGDGYLAALAEVLQARALHALQDGPAAVGLMQEQLAVAQRIGSADLEQVAGVYLGQFLQRGVSPGTPQWQAAEEVLARGLDRATDPFTRAELLLPLAHLHTTSGEFDLAADELTEYGRIYALMGGNQISDANLFKARARLELARHGGTATRSRLSPRAARAVLTARAELRRAARAYRKAGLEPGRQSVTWHISLIDVLATGRSSGTTLPQRSADPLDRARHHLLLAEIHRSGGRPREAAPEYTTAEENAVAAGATMLAVAASSGAAEVATAVGNHSRARSALRATVDHAENVRAAILSGAARGNIATGLRSYYERALLLAARLGDGPLALELVERLRTERLAGLLRRPGADLPPDLVELLARLDEVNDALVQLEPGIRATRPTRGVRQLTGGGAAHVHRVREELHVQLAARTTELFAGTYGAEPVTARDLDMLREGVLAVVPLHLDDDDVIISVWRAADGATTEVTVTPTGPDLHHLREVLTDNGAGGLDRRVRLTWHDLLPVAGLLPPALRAEVAAATEPLKLLVVPTGWLWAVPFAAVPLDPDRGHLLVDGADIVLTPSVRFAAAHARRERPPVHAGAAVSWIDPGSGFTATEVDHLRHHPGGHTSLGGPEHVRDAFVRGGPRWRTAVLAAHGNREPGLAQAAVAGGRSVLAAADFLDGAAAPPRFVSFASCHSGYPDGDDPHEPLGLALAALAAGAEQVLSAHFEIDGRGAGSLVRCLCRLYDRLASTSDAPAALARELRDPAIRARNPPEPLYRWAALTIIGTHPSTTEPIGQTDDPHP